MFELVQVTQVAFTHANVRTELHGEEHVRAVDIAMEMEGENTLLDLFEPGLREYFYCNRALKAGQEVLPGVIIPLPNLRFPKLPSRLRYAKEEKLRGYRFVLDYGLGDDQSNLDFTDCALSNRWCEVKEGGSCKIGWTIQYNGEELTDDAVFGRVAGLGTVGVGHVQVLAPPILQLVQKGFRSGREDTGGSDGGGSLLDGDDQDQDDEDTPEKALERAHGG